MVTAVESRTWFTVPGISLKANILLSLCRTPRRNMGPSHSEHSENVCDENDVQEDFNSADDSIQLQSVSVDRNK